MHWPFYFHAAVDIFIMLGILYILLVLIEFRRKIYPARYNRPNDKDDDANEDSGSGKEHET